MASSHQVFTPGPEANSDMTAVVVNPRERDLQMHLVPMDERELQLDLALPNGWVIRLPVREHTPDYLKAFWLVGGIKITGPNSILRKIQIARFEGFSWQAGAQFVLGNKSLLLHRDKADFGFNFRSSLNRGFGSADSRVGLEVISVVFEIRDLMYNVWRAIAEHHNDLEDCIEEHLGLLKICASDLFVFISEDSPHIEYRGHNELLPCLVQILINFASVQGALFWSSDWHNSLCNLGQNVDNLVKLAEEACDAMTTKAMTPASEAFDQSLEGDYFDNYFDT